MILSARKSRDSVDHLGHPSKRFEDFYRRSSGEVFRILTVVLRDRDLAQEATDEAMTRAYERWSKVGGYDNPTGWVYRVALNWARSRLRKHGREGAIHHEPTLWVDPMPDPDLDAAVARLPLHQREVVVFRFLLDLTQEQIAEALQIPIGTVKSRLHRALETLRQEVTDRD